jgi:hypothetical protein
MSPRIKLNSKAVRALLRSAEMVKDLDNRASRIAQAAGPGHSYQAKAGSRRALAAVWTTNQEAREGEARGRNLSRAIDAGR